MTAGGLPDARRRSVSVWLGLLAMNAGFPGARAVPLAAPHAWDAWRRFDQRFLGAGDRVIDPASSDSRTTSEGQAYALFFCLVANDQARFEQILRWTEDHLCQGDLILRLPAWLWAQRPDGSFGVQDDNSAADADLWIAYVLAEAGRLWGVRRYLALAAALRARILDQETLALAPWGRILMPGRTGFAAPGQWRLNPSYAPLFLLRRCATLTGDAVWQEMLHSQSKLLHLCADQGWAPDWVVLQVSGDAVSVRRDADHRDDRVGSYDAIRIYLWLALDAADDLQRRELLARYRQTISWLDTHDAPPERIDVTNGKLMDAAADHPPIGFFAVMEAFCLAQGASNPAQRMHAARVAAGDDLPGYYDQALTLFATGWIDGRFAFGADGRLEVPWHGSGA